MGQKDQWYLLKCLSKRKKTLKIVLLSNISLCDFPLSSTIRPPWRLPRDVMGSVHHHQLRKTSSIWIIWLVKSLWKGSLCHVLRVCIQRLNAVTNVLFFSLCVRLFDLPDSIRHSLWELLSSICVFWSWQKCIRHKHKSSEKGERKPTFPPLSVLYFTKSLSHNLHSISPVHSLTLYIDEVQ